MHVTTSDDANDWPCGNDLLRQGERKKGPKQLTDSYVSNGYSNRKLKGCSVNITIPTSISKVRLLLHPQ